MDALHTIARETARETVKETFLALGVDMSTPKAIQEMQQDFAWTRTARLTVRKLRMHALTAAVTLVVTGTGTAIWMAVKAGGAVAGAK